MKGTMSPYTILLVDDNQKYLYTIGQFIWDSPHAGTVMRASDAEMALSIATEYRPSIIFLDIHLATTCGLTLISAIKMLVPDCKIFMLSNCTGEHYRSRATALGAEGLLDKTHDFVKIPGILEGLAEEAPVYS